MTAVSRLELISNRKARVVINDPSSAVRDAFYTVLRGLGFTDIKRCAGFRDLDSILEDQEPDWLISSMFADRDINVVTYFESFNKKYPENQMIVSVLVGENLDALPKLFAAGITSYHPIKMTNPLIKSGLEKFIQEIGNHSFSGQKTAYNYFKNFLNAQGMWHELIQLEKGMIEAGNDSEQFLLSLAECYFKIGNKAGGRTVLNKAKLFDSRDAQKIASLQETYLRRTMADHVSFAKCHEMKKAVVIDADKKSTDLIKNALQELGIENIRHFIDGDKAWDFLKDQDDIDLIVQEWQIAGLAGPYLIQRIRDSGKEEVPIVVASGFLEKRDVQLLKDMSVSQVLKKPLRAKQLTMALSWSIIQFREPSEVKTIERKIIQCLNGGNKQEAAALSEKYLEMDSVSPSRRKYVEASFFFHAGKYSTAVTHLKEAINFADGEHVDLISLLSRCLMKLGDYEASIVLMEKASILSPQNVSRVCLLADLNLQAGKEFAAKKLIRTAEKLDKGNAKVIATKAKAALLGGNGEQAQELMQSLASVADVVSFMNNKAVAFIKTGQVEEGTALYHRALDALGDKYPEFAAIVNYNLGLALLRNGETLTGAKHITKATEVKSRVFEKALSLNQRIKDSIKKGEEIKLSESDSSNQEQDNERARPLNSRGLLGIYEVHPDTVYSADGLHIVKFASREIEKIDSAS